MTSSKLYEELNSVDHSRERRQRFADIILKDSSLIYPLLDLLNIVNDPISCRAAWVLEYACRENIALIVPYLDTFLKVAPKVSLDGAVRPVAKIMECLAEAYYLEENDIIKHSLKKSHIEAIVEVCFDYLINDEKIAPKAYSMNTLFLFGKDLDWVHPELKTIIERDYQIQSSGFKARARQILKKLAKAK